MLYWLVVIDFNYVCKIFIPKMRELNYVRQILLGLHKGMTHIVKIPFAPKRSLSNLEHQKIEKHHFLIFFIRKLAGGCGLKRLQNLIILLFTVDYTIWLSVPPKK